MGNSIQKYAFMPPDPVDLDDPIFVESDTYKIPILHFPYKNSRKVLIFSHGNATDLGIIAEHLKFLRDQLHVTVIGYDYLGYGFTKVKRTDNYCNRFMDSSIGVSESAEGDHSYADPDGWESPITYGFPSENGCYKSLWMTYNWVKNNLGTNDKDIILMGQSIGTGPTCEIASKVSTVSNDLGGVILITPFRSAVKVVTNTIFGWFVDFFRNEDKICDINSPILIIHGTSDEIVHPSHTNELAMVLENADKKYKVVWLEGAYHNNITEYSEYLYSLLSFINNL